ncbi:hypothetical protein [Microcoleus sp.]|uniref:hypothetical protein n=1 Tax=Microcoleus sp. TaxID=44472 RepID=UPI0035262810
MHVVSPRCASFFEADSEYADLECGQLAAKRYLRLICSADYWSKLGGNDPDGEPSRSANNVLLPTNVLTIGRRITPALRIKILRALEVFPTKSDVRVYELFFEVKFRGFVYDYKRKVWEFRAK